ncbi:MAG TPA: Wzz/FepE/Etk N-terminal domain-containing protein [Syntrophomonadaceae bacterium]|nr:Wzz/FepE/Etk N-terminal domain-containing protein [Syntrophomonadaceae bacterium]
MSDYKPVPSRVVGSADIDIYYLIKVLKKWWKLIVALTLAAALVSGLFSFYVLKPVYRASTLLMVTVASEKLQVSTQQLNRNNQDNNNSVAPMPVLTMNTYLGQLESEVVMKRVVESTGIPELSIGALLSMTDASIVEDSNLIVLEVESNDPHKAALIANAVAEQYLKLMDELMFSSVVVISPANVPPTPIKPNKMMNIALALLLGLMISVLLAFLLDFLDNTLKTVEDIDQVLDLPVLAVIPAGTKQSSKQHFRE